MLPRLRALVVPDLPEPIDEAQWRWLSRLGVGVAVAFALFNLASVVFTVPLHRAAFHRHLAIILPTQAVLALISLLNFREGASERRRRLSMYAAIPLVLWTGICGMFMDEVIETNSLLIVICLAFFRTALDERLGLYGLVWACLLQGFLWLLVHTGVWPPIAVTSETAVSRVASAGRFAGYTYAWQLMAYTLAWFLSSTVANRFRVLAHAVVRERQRARTQLAELVGSATHGRLTGQVVNGLYYFKELLGRGGMGEVYEAKRLDDSELVAIKVLFPHLLDVPQMIERFEREVAAVRRLTKASTAEVIDSGVAEDGSPYLVMERLRGEDLAAVLRRRGHLACDEWSSHLAKLAALLDTVHEQGIVHRDLKPSNVFMLENGDVRVLDFGVARLVDSRSALTLTGDQSVIGSPGFLAPEQVRREPGIELGAWTDVFGLGAITYRVITGQNAFPSRNATEAILEALEHQPLAPSRVRPDLPPQLDAVLAIALAKVPRERYARASELAHDFALAARGALPEETLARAAAISSPDGVTPVLGRV